jgi:hypothetical protein
MHREKYSEWDYRWKRKKITEEKFFEIADRYFLTSKLICLHFVGCKVKGKGHLKTPHEVFEG